MKYYKKQTPLEMFYGSCDIYSPLILNDYLQTFDKKRVVLGGKQVTISCKKMVEKRRQDSRIALLAQKEASCKLCAESLIPTLILPHKCCPISQPSDLMGRESTDK